MNNTYLKHTKGQKLPFSDNTNHKFSPISLPETSCVDVQTFFLLKIQFFKGFHFSNVPFPTNKFALILRLNTQITVTITDCFGNCLSFTKFSK